MNHRNIMTAGATLGALLVITGAFGAHLLDGILTGNGRKETYELAERYGFYHTFALLFTGLLLRTYNTNLFRWSAMSFLAGILVFCGSLMVLSITNVARWGAVTPLGGLFLIAGWVLLVIGIAERKSKN